MEKSSKNGSYETNAASEKECFSDCIVTRCDGISADGERR
jgi:hypothetical protein